MIRQVRPDTSFFPSIEVTANSNSEERGNLSAKTIEFWVDVTALGASGDYDLNFQTSVLKQGEAVGTKFVTQETINITATGLDRFCL